jgi:hypothetical protein
VDNAKHKTFIGTELFTTPLTAVVGRKRKKKKTADGEMIIKWNVFSPFASSNSRGTF